jgi:hypothetical protein
MSSHKEAPGIANDAAADNTDVYAFVSPDKPDTVTLIANFVPLQDPASGPNFFEFGDDVLYEIHVDNDGDAKSNVTYQFRFTTEYRNPDTFLYNTGPIDSLDSPNWNRRQFATVTRIDNGTSTTLGTHLPCPPCNVGPRSTPNYTALAASAIHDLQGGERVFTGQRAEGFYVDLGAIFDLGILRPFLSAHLAKMPAAPGVNATALKNIHTIAIQVPKTDLTKGNVDPKKVDDATSTIGVYASASRQKARVYNSDGTVTTTGPFTQVSRLANPLVNEVVINIANKDQFNSRTPDGDNIFIDRFAHPELAGLLPVLYPGVFPNLAKYKKARVDIEAILLTGIPGGIIPGFQNVTTPNTPSDLLRLNMAVPPTTSHPSNLGLVGGDAAGFPNGRRVFDDVTTIELRAVAGVTIPLVDPSFTPDDAAGAITPGLTSSNTDVTADNTVHYLSSFPYLGTPHSGFYVPGNNDPAPDLGRINQPPNQVPIVPVGPPQTGVGDADSARGWLIGGGLALAGAAAVGAAVARPRPATVSGDGTAAPDAGREHSQE